MTSYKHTQLGYLMMVVLLLILALFVRMYISALAEPSSVDSGPNLAVSAVMVFVLVLLASFTTLTTSIDENFLRIKFGYGIFFRKFALREIAKVHVVKNRWYYGWGIRLWLWPKMWIYNVSGFDAVEITMKNGKVYRIGTDVPKELEMAVQQSLHS
ncbi:MAG: hypothetical protein KBA91_00130 [Candidatus Moranbacteria bacterium]|nr:hypothetical protein [Candidatus Moranbacteria bacterium]